MDYKRATYTFSFDPEPNSEQEDHYYYTSAHKTASIKSTEPPTGHLPVQPNPSVSHSHKESTLHFSTETEDLDFDADNDAAELDGTRTLKVRLDKWLRAARFFKTRAVAREAVEAGRILYNYESSNPNQEVEIGAVISIEYGQSVRHLTITGLSARRRKPEESSDLFTENSKNGSTHFDASAGDFSGHTQHPYSRSTSSRTTYHTPRTQNARMKRKTPHHSTPSSSPYAISHESSSPYAYGDKTSDYHYDANPQLGQFRSPYGNLNAPARRPAYAASHATPKKSYPFAYSQSSNANHPTAPTPTPTTMPIIRSKYPHKISKLMIPPSDTLSEKVNIRERELAYEED